MKERQYGYTELGMMMGIIVGGGIATLLFVNTGDVLYFGLIGVGLALGLGLGAAFDRRRPDPDLEDGSTEERDSA